MNDNPLWLSLLILNGEDAWRTTEVMLLELRLAFFRHAYPAHSAAEAVLAPPRDFEGMATPTFQTNVTL